MKRLTSPPYYDTEIYSDNKSQAYYCSYEGFINEWWTKTVKNIYYITKPGGKFALNISNRYANDMLKVCFDAGFNEINRHYLLYRRKFNKQTAEPIIIMQK